MTFKKDDIVIVTYEGRTVTAAVTLASPNGRSLMIAWGDGMLGGHCGMMPILEEGGGYWSLIEGKPVTLKAHE